MKVCRRCYGTGIRFVPWRQPRLVQPAEALLVSTPCTRCSGSGEEKS